MDFLKKIGINKPPPGKTDKEREDREAERIVSTITVDQSGEHATVSIPKNIFGELEKEAVGHIISYQLLPLIMDDPFLAEGRNEGDRYVVKIPADKAEDLKRAILDRIRKFGD